MLLWRAVVGGWDCDVNRRRNEKKNGKKEKKENFHLHSYPSQIKYTFSIHECVYIILTNRETFLRLFHFLTVILGKNSPSFFGMRRHDENVVVVFVDVRIWKVIIVLATKGFTQRSLCESTEKHAKCQFLSYSRLFLLLLDSSPLKISQEKPSKSSSCLYINICVCLS